MRSKAFTLIEVIVTLVILAIIGLIAVPVVLNIIDKADLKSREKSIDAYGKAIELAAANYELNSGVYPKSIDQIDIKYSGAKVDCRINIFRADGTVYLSECSVQDSLIKDKKSADGYYQYGNTNEYYIDLYGADIEKQIKEYVSENNNDSLDLAMLENKYSNQVSCEIMDINYDDSIYLSKCRVDNIEAKDPKSKDGYYHYGVKKYQPYKIGDEVTYNGMKFYVIANSDEATDAVTMLKAEPLTVDELNKYGVGHVNNYNYPIGTVSDKNGYGGMAYYSSETCGYTNCKKNYEESEIKYAVDAWATDVIKLEDLKIDSLGYTARLITKDELLNNLGCSSRSCSLSPQKNWLYINIANCNYWTMSGGIYSNTVYYVKWEGNISDGNVNEQGLTRPVVTILKSGI